jgi:hypothetical protein
MCDVMEQKGSGVEIRHWGVSCGNSCRIFEASVDC